jgi:hypothetical protein
MIDGFAHSHSPIVLTDDRASIHDATFEDVRRICNDHNLEPVPLDLFAITPCARVQSMHVGLHLARYLEPRGLSQRPRLDQLLLEIAVLHRLKGMHEPNQGTIARSGRAVPIIGAMIQHRFTELLLCVETRQRTRIFGLWKLPSLNKEHWVTEFVGAAAVVRVIKGFHVLSGIVIQLPTVHEDVDLGIDLFVEIPPRRLHLAISIKSVNRPERLFAEHLLGGWDPKALNGTTEQQRRIVQGSVAASDLYSRRFIPVRILVGRTENSNYGLFLDNSEILALEQLIDRIGLFLQIFSRLVRTTA